MKSILSITCALMLVSASALADAGDKHSSNTSNMQESINESTDTTTSNTTTDSTDQQAGQAAGTNTSTDMSSGEMKTYSPAAFKREMGFNKLHHIHQTELEMAKLATERAQSQDVKNYAMQIQRDHEAADKKLQQIAQTQNIELKSFQPSTSDVATVDRLRTLEGANFDRAFMDVAKMSHEWGHEALNRLGKDVNDPSLKAQISELKPKFNQHLKVARSIKIPATTPPTDSTS